MCPDFKPDDVVSILNIIDRLLSHLKAVDPESRGLKLFCPENRMEFSVVVKPGYIRKHVVNKIAFPSDRILNIEVISAPFFNEVPQACYLDKVKSVYVLDYSKLGTDCESALLRIQYDVNGHDIVKKLVDRKSQKDVMNDNENNYWMTASLRNLRCLERINYNLDLNEVDVNVDVGIYENMRVALPTKMVKRFEALGKAIGDDDREKRLKEFLKYNQLRLQKSSGNDFSKINELRPMFYGSEFKKFVEVDRPFVYNDANPDLSAGQLNEYFGIPKQVRVISRTNLGLTNPSSEGYLHYKPNKLKDYIQEYFQ